MAVSLELGDTCIPFNLKLFVLTTPSNHFILVRPRLSHPSSYIYRNAVRSFLVFEFRMTMHKIQSVDNQVKGRLALVTGARYSSPMLLITIARALAAEGCDVSLHYSSGSEKAEALAAELRVSYPAQLFPCIGVDLADRNATRILVQTLFDHVDVARKHTAVSILVASAGVANRIRDIQDIEEIDWDKVMEVNARSQFVVTKACLPGMRCQGWGRVILIGSISRRGGGINGCHYAASKGALTSMGRNLATLLAPEGITVNIVEPAVTRSTGMVPAPKSQTWESNVDLDALKDEDPGLAIAASIPMHRLGEPEEVANIVVM
ncbi:3-oxoacyl-[acyl-carrier-protein] reductase FabG [Penicillium rolfsii]|nr:3-oxoacyl-[acyl-carrier-protein] reductase FabG [Penicillium rolfsii]